MGARSKIAPLTDTGVTQESVMRFIRVAEYSRVENVTTYLAERANGSIAINFCSQPHGRIMAQRKRPADDAAFHYFSILSQVNRPFRSIDNAGLHFNSLFCKNIFAVDDMIGRTDFC